MIRRLGASLLAIGVLAAACTSAPVDESGEADSPTSSEPVVDEGSDNGAAPADPVDIEVALVWHQHQPRYPVVDGVVTRPWVRLHAAKDYVDMATLVDEFPDLALTINLTPVLLDQLVELSDGTRDTYWVVAETPVDDLTDQQRQFIVDRFFDVNADIVDLFPRYVELRRQREAGTAFTDQDLVDLRALFHLAWLDPEVPERVELLERVGGPTGAADFDQDDTDALLAAHQRLVDEVIATHADLWADDRIEVITSPLAHPILPLIADTSLATVGDPSALLPREPFREFLDAAEQVERGLDTAESLLGQRPVGMWPGEGAVAQPVMRLFARNDVEWVATGEDVLARSLDIGGFERNDDDTVVDAATLYRPYRVDTNEGPVHLFFRDNRISDLIGFEYSGMSADEAVDDLMSRLHDIRLQLATVGVTAEEAPLVTIVLDGENAWEHYPNDGRDFLRAMYRELTSTAGVRTTTPAAYLADHPDIASGVAGAELAEVFPAAWFSPDFGTWIGEPEEQRAWELLRTTRLALRKAEQDGRLTPDALERATVTMLHAEGSDWFWWYGADQESGDDRYFDDAYRELLGQVYDAIGEVRPRSIDVPIIPDPALEPQIVQTDPVTITIDGDSSDWVDATTYRQTDITDPLYELGFAVDDEQLAIRVDGGFAESFEIYLQTPRGTSRRGTTIDDRLLGFDATHLLRYDDATGACLSSTLLGPNTVNEYPQNCTPVEAARSQSVLEIGIPLTELGAVGAGDRIVVRVATDQQLAPSDGAVAFPAPDVAGFEPTVDLIDPSGDDVGAGAYTYPTDAVFTPGSFDLVGFRSGVSGDDAVFSFAVEGAVTNPWNSPVGLATQTFDVYLDLDPGAGTGRSELLDGRNARLPDGHGWEAALTIEGWDSAVATADGEGYSETTPTMSILVLATEGRVTVRVPLAALPAGYDPSTTAVAVALLGQEGFPSAGVRRVRDVADTASQWAFGSGGAPTSSAGGTRVIDALDPDGDQPGLADGIVPINQP